MLSGQMQQLYNLEATKRLEEPKYMHLAADANSDVRRTSILNENRLTTYADIMHSFVQQDPVASLYQFRNDKRANKVGQKHYMKENVNRRGTDYKRVSFVGVEDAVQGAKECTNLCFHDDRCKSWSFISTSNECWLKAGIPTTRESIGTYSGAMWFRYKCY